MPKPPPSRPWCRSRPSRHGRRDRCRGQDPTRAQSRHWPIPRQPCGKALAAGGSVAGADDRDHRLGEGGKRSLNHQRRRGFVDGLQGEGISGSPKAMKRAPSRRIASTSTSRLRSEGSLRLGRLLRMISAKASIKAGTLPWRSTRSLKLTGPIPSQRISRTTSLGARSDYSRHTDDVTPSSRSGFLYH